MRKFAVIDIGSNSVRLMFVADGKVLYKRLNTTRLGEGLAERPLLKEAAIERTAQAVSCFYGQALNEGAETVCAFATAAVRSAENREEFLSRVKTLCGLDIEVVSGEEEAALGLVGALGDADGTVIDIGGASTEIVVRAGGETVYKKSVNIGVVRLKDACGRKLPLLNVRVNTAIEEFGVLPKIERLYAIGGTATTLAAQCLRLVEYDSKRITGAKITIEEVEELVRKFAESSVEEIAAFPCMPTGRADVILGGAVLLAALMRRYGFSELIVSDRDNLEGYAVRRGLMEWV